MLVKTRNLQHEMNMIRIVIIISYETYTCVGVTGGSWGTPPKGAASGVAGIDFDSESIHRLQNDRRMKTQISNGHCEKKYRS